jgi:hypothetical protein
VDPALISITKGEPTAEELAALLTVLLACEPRRPRPRAARGTGWRVSGLRSRSWRGPTSWSTGTRDWTHSP